MSQLRKNTTDLNAVIAIANSLPNVGGGGSGAGYEEGYESGAQETEDKFITRSIEGDYSNDRVTKIGSYSFFEQAGITSIDFPAVTTIGDFVFANCKSIKTVNIPLVKTMGANIFLSCELLEKADFPLVSSLGGYSFRNCYKLKEVNLPLVTSLLDCLFDMPNGTNSVLTKLDFPKVTSIKQYAFRRCSALMTLILRESIVATLANTNAFTNTPIASGTGYIYVPADLVESYKVATNWTTFASQIRSIDELEEA